MTLLPVDVPLLPLRACSVEEHCRALTAMRKLPFLWHQGVSRVFGNYSLPFQDPNGTWWYQVKPGLCWPVDFLRPLKGSCTRPPLRKSFLGYQHVVGDEAEANSHLVINVVRDLASYGPQAIDSKRRTGVRKGIRNCRISVLTEFDPEAVDGCRTAWDELTRRTGWRRPADPEMFENTWKMLLGCPGVTIIVGRDAQTGEIAGFRIVKIIGDTAYGDTTATRDQMLKNNVNDALLFSFVSSAANLPGVTTAHLSMKSNVESLEQWKTSLGFTAVPFPAITHLRGLTRPALRVLKPASYRRMIGQFSDSHSTDPD